MIFQLWVGFSQFPRQRGTANIPAAPVDREMEEDGTVRHGAAKHQAILSMDMATWREIIDTFDLKEPLIKHRKEATHSGPGARGWYS